MTDYTAADEDVRCMKADCDHVALEWWWLASVEGARVFRCFCLAHADDERAADKAAFGSDYVPGSDGNDDHA